MAATVLVLIPIGFIYIRDLLNDKVVNKSDVSKVTDMPIIGEISHHKMADREVVIGDKDRSIIAEQFRITRTNLQYFFIKSLASVFILFLCVT